MPLGSCKPVTGWLVGFFCFFKTEGQTEPTPKIKIIACHHFHLISVLGFSYLLMEIGILGKRRWSR